MAQPVVHKNCPPDCPTDNAKPYNGYLYRACRKFPALPIDLQSDAERQRPGKDPSVCQNWGLSVWIDKEAVEFARSALAFTRKRYIVRFEAGPDDGRIQLTPSNNQKDHYTFWKFEKGNLANPNLFLEPVKADDPA